MADYQAQIRLGVQGLSQLNQLNTALERATQLFGNLENAQVIAGQIAQGAQRNVGAAARRRAQAGRNLAAANRTVQNVAMRRDPETGRFLSGGPNATARRLATAQRRLAQREVREADRSLGESLENRSVIRRAERRYARALNRTADVIAGTQGRAREQSTRIDQVMRNIAQGSRGNYLTNLFQGRQQELARGGGGRSLPVALQEQARNVRAAWDLATAGGRENLQLMQRLATEMAGLVRQQNELNRARGGRSAAYEAGRRGRERITDLSRMPGADPNRIRRLRSQTTRVIAAGFAGDAAETKLATRRMNASIGRYERELRGAAAELRQQRQASFRDFNVQQNWRAVVSQAREIENMPRALPSANMLAERIARTSSVAPTRLDKLKKEQEKRLAQEAAEAAKQVGRFAKKLEQEEKRLASLGIGAPARVGGSLRRTSAIAMGGGVDSGVMPRALPSANMLAERIARTSSVAPTRLDKLKKEQEKRLAQEAAEAAKQSGRFARKLEQEEKRRASLGYGASARVGAPARRTGAVPMGGGADSGIVPRALPSAKLLEQRIALSGQRQPTRLDDLQAAAQKRAAEETKRATGSVGRFAAALEREEKRLASLGIGAPARVGGSSGRSRTGAIPMGGQGGRPGMFDQYAFPAGPGNVYGAAEFKALQRDQKATQRAAQQKAQPGFFRGDLRKAAGEGLIGGAFPLLFGQGLGASAGGFAGGFGGGLIGGSFGFGLSLVGTALGQVVDTTINKLGDLGGALGSASDSIEAMEQAGFRVRDSQKVQIAQLQKVGRGYDAQKETLKEIESRLGAGSVAKAEKLSEAQKKLSDSWAALSLQIGVALIPAITGAANLIADLFGRPGSGSGNGAAPTTSRPRKPSEVLADIDASMALNEAYKAGNREYASLVREVEDWRRDNEEKIFDMRRQGVDIEKQKSDLRLDVENKIFDMRQETAKMETDNARSRAQLAIESFSLELSRRSDALGGRGGDFIDQVREYLQARDQGESELQVKEKTAKLQIAAKERELQQYILQVSEKVASISRAVEDYKRDQAKFRFESGKRLEDYRIKTEDYIYARFRDRYEYAIGSEQEILRIKMQAAAATGATLPPDAGRVLGAAGQTSVGMNGLANPLGPQKSGRPPNWNQGLGAGRGHEGQDVGVDVGTTIHAIEDAVVHGIIKGFGDVGDAVVLRYANSDKLGVYGHINPSVRQGQSVKAGEQIGVVTPDIRPGGINNTHLHYELWKRSRRGPGSQLLDPTDRLRSAMSGRRVAPSMPVTPSQRGAGPAMLLPGVTGTPVQPSAPTTTDSMFDRRQSSARPGIGDQFISLLGKQGGFEDVAMTRGEARAMLNKFGQEAIKGNVSPQAFVTGLNQAGSFANSPDESRRTIRNMMATPGARMLVNTPGLAPMAIRRIIGQNKSETREAGVNPAALDKHIGFAVDLFKSMKRDKLLRSNVSLKEIKEKLQQPLYGALMDWVKANMANPKIQEILGRTSQGRSSRKIWGAKGILPRATGLDPKVFGVNLTPEARKEEQEYAREEAYRNSPAGQKEERRRQEEMRLFRESQLYIQKRSRELELQYKNRSDSSASPSSFDVSKIGSNLGNVASTGLAGLLAQAPTALPVVPFSGALPTYKPAPMATPTPPAPPELPPAPAPMMMPSIEPLTNELGKQKDELLESVELARKLQKVENGRLLLQLASTREVRNRLDDAAKEFAIESEISGLSKSLSQNEQDRAIEKTRTAFAVGELNTLEQQSLGFADELLKQGKLQQQEYDQITQGIRDRIGYEKELLQIVEDRAEVARTEAYNQRSGELIRSAALTGAGLRAGLVGAPARAFESEMALSGNSDWAGRMAELAKRLEDQQLIWDNLEKNIVDVSDAISGGLTNGLLDVISGARKIEDVGRDVLNSMARSFADSAQQQLSTLMQRQLGSLLGGAGGPLTKMLGAGTEAAGAQSLGTASMLAASQVAAFGMALQTVAAQMGFSGALGGGSGLAGGLSGAFSSGLSGAFSSGISSSPNLFGNLFADIPDLGFGGFFANGGTTRPGEAYVVGENEPEFFFPGVSGRVVPRSDMQKAEALRQDSAEAEPIDVRYTVTEQRGERYVTEAQFRKGMADTAKRSQAMTYAGMRNNKEVRSFVDI